MKPLPIDVLIPQIQEHFRSKAALILQAEPGAGKTTRVPPALLNVVPGRILVLEPRRLAARLSAARIAEELGETVGQTAGYQIRFEKVAGENTRLLFITEGLFVRMIASDPMLSDTSCVILDEFHERHLHTDIALALVRHLQTTRRPDLKLAILSATLDTLELSEYLPEALVLRSEGREHPVTIRYASTEKNPLAERVAKAAAELITDPGCSGHILVFLPGIGEIRKAATKLEAFASEKNFEVLQLRSGLTPQDERRVFAASSKRKIILSTNIAETSITIDGITGVIDSGLAKIPEHAPWSGLPQLHVRPVSRSSCIQRAGRAGRTAPGIVIRLYSKHDFETRTAHEKPELQRLDLSQPLLDLKAAASRMPAEDRFDVGSLPWLQSPSASLLESSESLLKLLGALNPEGGLTSTGRRMAMLPLHPRLSRAIIESESQNIRSQMILAASILNEGGILKKDCEPSTVSSSDTILQMELFHEWMARGRSSEVDSSRARAVKKLCALLDPSCTLKPINEIDEDKIGICLLAGFPDRVARARKSRDRIELLMCTGGSAQLSRASTVRDSEFVLALEAEETREHQSVAADTRISTASSISREALLGGPAEYLREESEFFWDSAAEKAKNVSRLRYGVLILEETTSKSGGEELESVLRRQLMTSWPAPFETDQELRSIRRRADLLRQAGFEFEMPDFADRDFERLIAHIVKGKTSFAEVKSKEIQDYVYEMLPARTLSLLNENAPVQIQLRSGRKTKVNYELGKPPYVSSWIQDFFGTSETPRIASGRIPVVIHLLAPNRRPVQVTQDLKGFWKNHYPDLRKQLSRRYPKHAWPENPSIR